MRGYALELSTSESDLASPHTPHVDSSEYTFTVFSFLKKRLKDVLSDFDIKVFKQIPAETPKTGKNMMGLPYVLILGIFFLMVNVNDSNKKKMYTTLVTRNQKLSQLRGGTHPRRATLPVDD